MTKARIDICIRCGKKRVIYAKEKCQPCYRTYMRRQKKKEEK